MNDLPNGIPRREPNELPPAGTVVLAVIEYPTSGATLMVELMRVEEDDVTWRTADDRSELSYDWSVIGWKNITD